MAKFDQTGRTASNICMERIPLLSLFLQECFCSLSACPKGNMLLSNKFTFKKKGTGNLQRNPSATRSLLSMVVSQEQEVMPFPSFELLLT